MSTLTGNEIKNTYQGLLKLANSTTGITSSFQQIEDGLGNNTNTRISTLGITSPNIGNINGLKPDYGGMGFSAGAGTANVAGSQLKTLYIPVYEPGFYSYSAISYNLGTLTSTSDVVTMAIYTLQQVNNIGYAPKDLIMSGITLTSTGTTGVKTTSLPSTLSFSGYGGGYFVFAFYVSNGNVTPTVRYGVGNSGIQNGPAYTLGLYRNQANTGTNIGARNAPPASAMSVLNLGFQSSYSTSDIVSNINTTIITQPIWGVTLDTIF